MKCKLFFSKADQATHFLPYFSCYCYRSGSEDTTPPMSSLHATYLTTMETESMPISPAEFFRRSVVEEVKGSSSDVDMCWLLLTLFLMLFVHWSDFLLFKNTVSLHISSSSVVSLKWINDWYLRIKPTPPTRTPPAAQKVRFFFFLHFRQLFW